MNATLSTHRQVFSHEHAVRHVLNHGRRARAVLEPNRVPDLLAQIAAELLGDSFSHGHRRNPPRLGTPDHACAEHPNGLEIEKEATPGIVRWPRVEGTARRDAEIRTTTRQAHLRHVLRHLRRFSRPSFSDHY